MAGSRAAQVAKLNPLRKKTTNTAIDARSTARDTCAGALEVVSSSSVSRWRRHRPSGAHDVVRLVVRASARGRRRGMEGVRAVTWSTCGLDSRVGRGGARTSLGSGRVSNRFDPAPSTRSNRFEGRRHSAGTLAAASNLCAPPARRDRWSPDWPRDAEPEVRPCLRTAPPWPTSQPPRTSPSRPPRSRSRARVRSPRRPASACWTPPPRSTTRGPTPSAASCAAVGPGSWASWSATRCAGPSATPSPCRCSTAWSAPWARSTSASCSSPGRATPAAPRSTPCWSRPPWTSR